VSRLTRGRAKEEITMSSFRTITAAGIATLALAGGAALAGSSAHAEDGDDHTSAALARPAERALVATCDGGAVLRLHTRSMDFQSVTAGTTAEVEGSQWNIKGPKEGADVVLVTLTSMASSGGAGELATASFYKDGVATAEGAKYLTYNGILDQATVQFCTKIGKGQHTLAVRVTDGGGGATTLYYPNIGYQVFS
jgi:hypothetical protein